MSALFSYIIRRYLIVLLISLIAVMLFSFLADTIESSKTITQENVSAALVLSLLFNKFIVMAVQTFPLSVYLSLIIIIFSLHIKNEYLSFLTSGLNPGILIAFLLVPLVLLSGLYFYLLNSVLPASSKEVDRLLVSEFRRFTASWTYFYRDRNWFSGKNNCFYHYISINETERIMKGFEIIRYDDNGIYEITAFDSVRHIGGGEYKADGIKRYTLTKDGRIELSTDIAGSIFLEDGFDIFRQMRGRPYQMSISEIRDLIKIRDRAGLDASRHRYEFYNRIFSPFSLLMLCLLIIILFVKRLYLLKGGYFLFMGLGILLCYVMLIIFAGKLSESSVNMPFAAALLPFLLLLGAFVFVLAGYPFRKNIRGRICS